MTSTLFRKFSFTTYSPFEFVEIGSITVPVIKGPVVCKNSNARDPVHSMYGYPAGCLVFCPNAFKVPMQALFTP